MDITRRTGYEEGQTDNPFVICDLYLNAAQSAYNFGGSWKDSFKDTLALMSEVVEKLDKNESLDDFKYTPIEQCINFLNCLVVERQREDHLLEFIKAFIFIAYNINENLEKYEAVRNKIAYLQRYCEDALTYEEVVDLNRKLTERISRWREWSPPSFRLSKHYYDLIKGE